MADRLLGMETEYAITGTDPKGSVIDRQRVVDLLRTAATERFAYAADAYGAGLFLQNGSRFYADCGVHPELATPECADPADVVRYVQAGERILADLARCVAGRLPEGTKVELFRCNVDYSGSGTTWGCHESYLHRAEPMSLADQLIPHLVTRVIYTGAGGWNPASPGLEFSRSPRVHYLVRPISGDSTSCRGIFHTKDESLCGRGYHRLHVLCGDSCCSQLATWLKIGTTALVVALAEAGMAPGKDVQLWSPVDAMKRVAHDPDCRMPLILAGGRSARALDIQRHYLARAEAHAGDAFMPPWAGDVCRAWRGMLDRIEHDASSLATQLDWVIKQSLYAQHARRRGVAWEAVSRWTEALTKLENALKPDDEDAVPVGTSLARRHARALAPLLRERGLSPADIPLFARLRQELFEIDTRFGQLGERGIFAALDRQGTLAHHVPGVDRIEQAVTDPPSFGRAALRGNVIRRATRNGRYLGGWQQLWDLDEHRVLDLSDPFETTERWSDTTPTAPAPIPAAADVPPFREMSRALREWLRARGERRSEAPRG